MKGGWSGVRTSHSLSYQPDICLRVTAFAPPALRPLCLRRSGRYASGAQAVMPPALRPLRHNSWITLEKILNFLKKKWCTWHVRPSDGALMMHWWCTDDALMMLWWCTDDALMTLWWCTADALKMHWSCTDDTLMMRWWCTDHALRMLLWYCWCADEMLMMCC